MQARNAPVEPTQTVNTRQCSDNGVSLDSSVLAFWSRARPWKTFRTTVLLLALGILASCTLNQPGALTLAIKGQEVAFVQIPAGEFEMGLENGSDREKPVHRVRISKPYQMEKCEVTMEQWDAVMEKNPSRRSGKGINLPVDSVTWEEVQEFIRRLCQRDREFLYRLPTEAEWEYACRAGRKEDFTSKLDAVAAWEGNSGNVLKNRDQPNEVLEGPKMPQPVGSKQSNPWGLHDMQGNVWEWVQDWYGPYSNSSSMDPQGPETGTTKVFRGGSWLNWGFGKAELEPSYRDHRKLGFRHTDLGFRLVRTPKPGGL